MEQDQSEQQVAQVEEHIEEEARVVEHTQQVEASAVCEICGRNGFRGARGVQIHQSKNAVCREMRRQAETRATILAAVQAAGGNGGAVQGEAGDGTIVEQAEGDVVVVEQAQEEQEQLAQPRSFICKGWAAVKELVWGISELVQWILKIAYSLMIMLFGLSNVYFMYLYLTEKTPITNKTTYLLSPDFEEEFRVL